MYEHYISKIITDPESLRFWSAFFGNLYSLLTISGTAVFVLLVFKRYIKYNFNWKKLFIYFSLLSLLIFILIEAASVALYVYNAPAGFADISDVIIDSIKSADKMLDYKAPVDSPFSPKPLLGIPAIGITAAACLGLIIRIRPAEVLDTIFLYFPIGHTFVRIGCFFSGCCWGAACTFTDGIRTVSFPHPAPLYEIILNLSIFFTARYAYNRIYSSENAGMKKIYGTSVAAIYFFSYGTGRFLIESLFKDEPAVFYGLSRGHSASLAFIFIAASFFVYVYIKGRLYNKYDLKKG